MNHRRASGSATCSTGLALVVALLVAVGCGQAETGEQEPAVRAIPLRLSPAGAGSDTALMQGVLRWDGAGCIWVETEGARVALIWPHGFSASGPPLRIRDSTGRVVASENEEVQLGGGLDPIVIPCALRTFRVGGVVE
jgi:hypothetical protein